MKIKTKKQLNFPQLIEWAFENPELAKSKLYLTKEHDEYSPYVQFSVDGYGVRTSQSISKDDTFTVEVEEEITEDTVFEYLINMYRGNGTFMELDTNECINEYNVANLIEVHAYIDGEFKLIWRNGKLVG